jgi:hypothetical protein
MHPMLTVKIEYDDGDNTIEIVKTQPYLRDTVSPGHTAANDATELTRIALNAFKAAATA